MLRYRYYLSSRVRLVFSGRSSFLVSDHPLQALRLNASAAALLRTLDGRFLDELVSPILPETLAYLDDLVSRGLVLPDPTTTLPAEWPPVRVIVPAYRDSEMLARCLCALGKLDYPPECLRIVVVDDASPEPLATRLAGQRGLPEGIQWHRLTQNCGPAVARNYGTAVNPVGWVSTVSATASAKNGEILAFTDSDCIPASDWLMRLVPVLEERGIAAVGGRVVSFAQNTWLGRYEEHCSSLNMGDRAGPVGLPGAPISYLPSCNLLVRRSAFHEIGGFRSGWRTGEDVDLCWRLVNAGYGIYYWPSGEVAHDHRTAPGAFAHRRWDYGLSEALLARAHPQRRHRLRGGIWLVVSLLLIALGCWLAGLDGNAGVVAPQGVGRVGEAWAGFFGSLALPDWWLPWLLGLGAIVGPSVWSVWVVLRRWPSELHCPTVRQWLLAVLRRIGGTALEQARAVSRRGLVAWLVPMLLGPAWAIPGLTLWGLSAVARHRITRSTLGKVAFFLAHGLDDLAYSTGRLAGFALMAVRPNHLQRSEETAIAARLPTEGENQGDGCDKALGKITANQPPRYGRS